jgi:hypothetical protein
MRGLCPVELHSLGPRYWPYLPVNERILHAVDIALLYHAHVLSRRTQTLSLALVVRGVVIEDAVRADLPLPIPLAFIATNKWRSLGISQLVERSYSHAVEIIGADILLVQCHCGPHSGHSLWTDQSRSAAQYSTKVQTRVLQHTVDDVKQNSKVSPLWGI